MAGLLEVCAQSNFRILSMIAYLMPQNYQTKVKSKEINKIERQPSLHKQTYDQTNNINRADEITILINVHVPYSKTALKSVQYILRFDILHNIPGLFNMVRCFRLNTNY